MNNSIVLLIIAGLILYALINKPTQATSNLETWSWTDYKGHKYEIEVHRRVE